MEKSQELTNEVEVAFATQSMRDETDHFMQSHSTIPNEAGTRQGWHVRIHLFVHQPESNRFVAHEGLVVAFRVSQMFLSVTTVRQEMNNVPDAPVIIGHFFEELQKDRLWLSKIIRSRFQKTDKKLHLNVIKS